MNKINFNINSRDISDRAYDLFGELLLERETGALLAEVKEDQLNGRTSEMNAFFNRCDAAYFKRIRQFSRKQKANALFKRTLPKIGQAAAIVITIVTLAGSVAVATSHTVRVHIMKLLITIEEEYSSLRLVENTDASFDVPAAWNGEYFPAYLPQGYSKTYCFSYEKSNIIEYESILHSNNSIHFSEYDADMRTNIDTEDTDVLPIAIGTAQGYISQKGDQILLSWDNGRYYFVLQTTGLSEDIALKIAQSVTRIK